MPAVGDLIQSATERRNGIRLELCVVRVTWRYREDGHFREWYPEIELHLPEHRFENILQFQNWYGYICQQYDKEMYQEMENRRREARGRDLYG